MAPDLGWLARIPRKRLPAEDVLRVLRDDGMGVDASHLADWVRRHHITRTPDGYLLAEVLAYLCTRPRRQRSIPGANLACSTTGCWGAHHARGLCAACYSRQLRPAVTDEVADG